ncbi:MAG: hypothetical protein R3A10_10725 [Caldilineaceae bacterium]
MTNYNNYYEFSTDKAEVARLSENFVSPTWAVEVTGLVNKPTTFDVDDLIRTSPRKSASTVCAAWKRGPW